MPILHGLLLQFSCFSFAAFLSLSHVLFLAHSVSILLLAAAAARNAIRFFACSILASVAVMIAPAPIYLLAALSQ